MAKAGAAAAAPRTAGAVAWHPGARAARSNASAPRRLPSIVRDAVEEGGGGRLSARNAPSFPLGENLAACLASEARTNAGGAERAPYAPPRSLPAATAPSSGGEPPGTKREGSPATRRARRAGRARWLRAAPRSQRRAAPHVDAVRPSSVVIGTSYAPPPVVSFCGCETARSLALRPLPPVRPLALSRRACSRPLSYPPRVSRDASARLPCDFSTSLPLFPPIATFFAPLPTCRSGGHRRGPASATEQRRNHGTRGQGRPRARR